MAKLKAISGGKSKDRTFSLICGLHLSPTAEVVQTVSGEVVLRDGRRCPVPLQALKGSREQIRAQVLARIEVLFDHYDGDDMRERPSVPAPGDEANEAGC